MTSDWANVALTTILTLAGLYFANNLRRRTRAEVDSAVATKRLPAYGSLWEKTKVASPMRGRPLTREERATLYDELTDWYYDGGQGMLLTEQTRNVYLTAKRNLICADADLVPSALAGRVAQEGDAVRGQASVDQLSLLRTSMRADVEIFTEPYDADLGDDDIAFLRACRVDLDRRPWRRASRAAPRNSHDSS